MLSAQWSSTATLNTPVVMTWIRTVHSTFTAHMHVSLLPPPPPNTV